MMGLIQHLKQEFSKAQDPLIARQMSAYMKNRFSFFGIKAPKRSLIEKEILKKYPLGSPKELMSTLKELWSEPEREFQMSACVIVYTYRKLWTEEYIDFFEFLIRTKSWWDSVDTIASKLVGTLLLMYPQLTSTMDRWIDDDDFWLRRTALIYQLSYKEKTDEERLLAYCTKRMHEKEFFIRKAIGWALRQYARTSPQNVLHFLQDNKESLSPLSYREAGKYCLKTLEQSV